MVGVRKPAAAAAAATLHQGFLPKLQMQPLSEQQWPAKYKDSGTLNLHRHPISKTARKIEQLIQTYGQKYLLPSVKKDQFGPGNKILWLLEL